jgi:hypothetical protein
MSEQERARWGFVIFIAGWCAFEIVRQAVMS